MLTSLSDGVKAQAMEAWANSSGMTAGQVYQVLLGVAFILCTMHIMKMYPVWKARIAAKRFAKSEVRRKKKREREAMDNREVRLRELMSEIITDGILDRQVKGELSDQEGKKLMKELSLKLNLPDIVSPKLRSQIVKQEIKARRAKGLYKNKPAIPGEPTSPPPVVSKLVNKYWRSKAA